MNAHTPRSGVLITLSRLLQAGSTKKKGKQEFVTEYDRQHFHKNSLINPFLHIYSFNTLKKKALGKHCGKR